MDARRRASLASALVLIGLGAWFLWIELSPIARAFAHGRYTWPLPIVGIGLGLFVIGLITWTPGLAIPACIVGGIGGLLYWQNATGHWASWSYAWSLIPGFVGVGIILAGLMRGRPRMWMRCALGSRPTIANDAAAKIGSASPEAVRLCRENGIAVIPGGCANMFLKPDFGHACMRGMLRLAGALAT